MLKLRYIFFIAFLAVFAHPVSGQQISKPVNNLPVESIQMHLSQELLFSGEMLYFSLYCENNSVDYKEISSLAFVELINENNASVIRKKIILKDGIGVGSFQLHDSLSSGFYTVLAYTNWLKNFGEEYFFSVPIAIINPTQPYAFNKKDSSSSSEKFIKKSPNHVTDKRKYGKREKIDLKLIDNNNKPLKGNFSISVKRKEPLVLTRPPASREIKPARFHEINILPDYKGIRVTGTVSDAGNNHAGNQEVLLSFPGKGTELNSTTTNEEGEFHFLLKPGSGNKDLVFTLPSNRLKLKLEDPFVNGLKNPLYSSMGIDSFALNYLKEKYFYSQLSQKYTNKVVQNSTLNDKEEDIFSFYSAPDYSFKIDDYILMDSIVEYFHELIPSVHFNRVKGKYQISVIYSKGKIDLGENPGVFVDGVLYTDFDNLAKILPEEIHKIEILAENYYYKDFEFNGIIDIQTKKADFYSVKLQDNMVRIIYPLADPNPMRYAEVNYENNSTASHQPDLRYLLFWSPSVNTEQTVPISFYSSDISGTFEISISGYNSNGKWIQITDEIEVVE